MNISSTTTPTTRTQNLGQTLKVSETFRVYNKPFGEMYYTSGTLPTRYTFTGQYSYTINTNEIGLLYYGARFYDPSLGRFSSADTIIPGAGNPQSWDRYAYTLNNPVKYTDPSGHFSEDAITDYLMGYFKGDEEAALRTLQLWKQDTAWWKMISAAQGGDILYGMQGSFTGAFQDQFVFQFTGDGNDKLTGLQTYGYSGSAPDLNDIRRNQLGAINPANPSQVGYEWVGFIRFNNGWPSFWERDGYQRIEKTTSDGARYSALIFLYSANLIIGEKITAGMTMSKITLNGLEFPLTIDLMFDLVDVEKGDVQVHVGPCYFNFQPQLPFLRYAIEPKLDY